MIDLLITIIKLLVFLLATGITVYVAGTYFIWLYEARKRREPLDWPCLIAGALREWVSALFIGLTHPLGWIDPGPASTLGERSGRPILLVHGYALNRACWLVFRWRLRRAGWQGPIDALNLRPTGRAIGEHAERLRERVELLLARTGATEVDIIAHSMGGLVARHYLGALAGTARVRHLITLATPHEGTYIAGLGPGDSAAEMMPGSIFLRRLSTEEATLPSLAVYSVHDAAIQPAHSGKQGQAVRLERMGHTVLLTSGHVFRIVWNQLLQEPASQESEPVSAAAEE